MDACLVGRRKLGGGLEREHCRTELRHGVRVGGHGSQDLDNVVRELGAGLNLSVIFSSLLKSLMHAQYTDCATCLCLLLHAPLLHLELGSQAINLLLGWNVSGEEQPKHGLWEGLPTWGCCWELFLALWDGVATESDALLGVEEAGFPQQTGDASHATDCHFDGGGAKDGLAVVGFEVLELCLGGGNLSACGGDMRRTNGTLHENLHRPFLRGRF